MSTPRSYGRNLPTPTNAPAPWPESVAELSRLPAGDRAGNLTGADFVIDGGPITTL